MRRINPAHKQKGLLLDVDGTLRRTRSGAPYPCHPDDVELSLGTKDQLLKEGSAFLELEKRYLHRSGAIVWVRMKIALARDSSGSPLYFVVQIEDITEHKRANEKMRESEDRFRMIADSCP